MNITQAEYDHLQRCEREVIRYAVENARLRQDNQALSNTLDVYAQTIADYQERVNDLFSDPTLAEFLG